MANKKYREERIKADKEKKYMLACGKLKTYHKFGIAISIAIILCFFFNWVYIYNTDISGSEVSISGFNTLFAAFSGNYSNAGKLFGDMAVPFYYYAADYCRILGILTISAFIISVLNLACQSIAAYGKAQTLSIVCLVSGIIQVILFVACFSVALSFKNTEILSKYCGGNPACYIKSLAIIPAIISAIICALSCIATVKFIQAKKLLN